jgi:hypothetical protein
LGTDDQHVDAPLVGFAAHHAGAANAIDDPKRRPCVRSARAADRLADRLDVMADAGATLHQRAEHGEGARMSGHELRDVDRSDGVTPRDLMSDDFDPKCFADVAPALGENASFEDDRFAASRHRINDCSLHSAGAGTGEHDDVVLRAKNVTQAVEHFGQRCPRVGRTMMRYLAGER